MEHDIFFVLASKILILQHFKTLILLSTLQLVGPDCSYRGCPGEVTNCTSHGHCNVMDQECYCKAGWKGDGCHIPDCPGTPDCNDRGRLARAFQNYT